MKKKEVITRTGTGALRYNVAQLLRDSVGAQRRYRFETESPDLNGDLELVAPLQGTITFTRIPEGVLVEVAVETVVRLACDRCLEPMDYHLKTAWEEEFHPSVDVHTGRHRSVDWDELDEAIVIDEHHILDLRESMRQHLVLALPTHPLCREDCAGLCPRCGANLNEEMCACSREPIDPRWAALATLLGDSEA